MKKLVFLLVLLVVASCKGNGCDADTELVELVKVEHKCTSVRVVKKGSGWRLLDVCGAKRFYELGSWCEDCSISWRERRGKK